MKSKKYIFIFSCISSIVSLILSIIFYRLTETNPLFDFLKDLFLGIFSGSIISIVITLIEYLDCKRKNLEQLFDLFCKQRYEFNKIIYFNTDDKDNINNSGLINEVIQSYQNMKYYHSAIGNIIVDSSFIWFPNKKFKQLMAFYGEIQNIYYKFIETDRNFQNFQNSDALNHIIVDYIETLQNKFFDTVIKEKDIGNNKVAVKAVYKKQIKEIDIALDYIGALCYGKKYSNGNKSLMDESSYICTYCYKIPEQ